MAMTCTKCGAEVLATGVCSACGHNAHVDLEIAAFMSPHINRARITLVVIGALYLFFGYRAFSVIAELKNYVDAWSGSAEEADLKRARDAVNLAYGLVIFSMASGAANIVLAAIAGKKTMLAFNIAMGIFVLHTCAQAYASGGVIFTSFLWWITAIFLGLGYQAARKAEKLRATGGSGVL